MKVAIRQVLFPRSVTEEQEAYARGFIDALLELQRQQQHKVTSSPLLQVVPDPRTGFLLPLTSPSDEGQAASLYTNVAPLQRVIPLQPSDTGSKLPSLDSVPPSQGVPLSVLRPGTLTLSDALSPGARRSTVVSTFGVKSFPPFVNDFETLDLSPSGRVPTRSMEQSITTDKKSSVLTTVPTVSCSLAVDQCGSDGNAPLVVDTHCDLPVNGVKTGQPSDGAVTTLLPLSVRVDTKSTDAQPTGGNAMTESPFDSVTLPTQPIDMSIQELAKIERKREKNRHAAQKCRMLKLERISRLEKRVSELKQQNETLAGTSGTLREQVNQLKQLIVHHVEGGCQIMSVHSLQTT